MIAMSAVDSQPCGVVVYGREILLNLSKKVTICIQVVLSVVLLTPR